MTHTTTEELTMIFYTASMLFIIVAFLSIAANRRDEDAKSTSLGVFRMGEGHERANPSSVGEGLQPTQLDAEAERRRVTKARLDRKRTRAKHVRSNA